MSFLRLKKHLSTKARSKASEKRCAKLASGKVQPASGAINRFDLKADVKSKEYLIDDKTTGAQSYALNVTLWQKLANEAWGNKKAPMIRIEFSNGPTLYVVEELTALEKLL